MSYTVSEDFLKKWKKKKDEKEKLTESDREVQDDYSVSDDFLHFMETGERPSQKAEKLDDSDFAPVKEGLSAKTEKDGTTVYRSKVNQVIDPRQLSQEKSWFQGGAFSNGFDWIDIPAAILGTATDLVQDAGIGVMEMGEKVVDTGAYLAGKVVGKFDKGLQDKFGEFIAKDLYNSEAIVKGKWNMNIADTVLNAMGTTSEEASLLGAKADSLAQSAGQLGATFGLTYLGVPWWVTTGTTSFGAEADNALNQGATYDEAGISAAISTAAEVLTEKMFGGSGLGEKGLINTEGLTKGISNKLVKKLTDFGIDMVSEGAEEVVAQVASNLGSSIYREENAWELLTNEEALEGYIDSFIGGAALGGTMNVGKVGSSIKAGRDYRTNLSVNEEAVFNKEVENRIAKEEEGGKKLTNTEKKAIEQRVMTDLKRGRISTDTIGELLGDNSEYDSIHKAFGEYESVKKEHAEFLKLYETESGKLSKKDQDRLAELEAKYKETPFVTLFGNARAKYLQSVSGLKDSYLSESFIDKVRVDEDLQYDISKYKNSKHLDAVNATLESAKKLGMNNTNAVHDVLDWHTNISSQTGVVFDYQTQKQINNDFIEKKTKEIKAIEEIPEAKRTETQKKLLADLKDIVGKVKSGKHNVDGYFDGKRVVMNMSSSTPLARTTGHEVTHFFDPTTGKTSKEWTALRDALFAYAKTKGVDIDGKLKQKQLMYSGIANANPEAELVADLVGDYLFTDNDFINNLSTKHRNVAQKIYDKIKHLLKLTTAGSKEARELERVKKAFEDAFRQSATKNTADGGVVYSITEPFTDSNGTKFNNAVLLDTDFFDGISPRNWGEKLRTMVYERASSVPFILPIVDESGNTTLLQFAKPNERVSKDGKSNHKVLDELHSSSDNISKLAVVHIDEIVSVSEENVPYYTNENNHQWLDENGWLHRNANVINKTNGNIYNLTIDIAKAADGRTILYATDGKIKRVGNVNVNSLKIKGSRQNSNSGDMVAETKGDVKRNLSEADKAYMDAVNRGDTETAQRLVDEAAEKWSKGHEVYTTDPETGEVLLKFYRSADGGRTVWNGHGNNQNQGVFLTSDPYIADAFDASLGIPKGQKSGQHITVYAKAENPFVIDAKGRGYTSIPIEEDSVPNWLYEASASDVEWSDDANDYITVDYIDIDNLFQAAFKQGHDAVIVNNVVEGVGGGLATDVVLKDGGKQMKSADPVTYDDDGNVIPLSERFNPENDDIRYSLSDSDGNQLSKGQQDFFKDSKVRDENGNLLVVYHGTKNGGFTIFDPKLSDDGISLFFASNPLTAATYAAAYTADPTENFNNAQKLISLPKGKSPSMRWIEGNQTKGKGKTGLYKSYLNLTNPLVVDAKGSAWNDISFESDRIEAKLEINSGDSNLYVLVYKNGKLVDKVPFNKTNLQKNQHQAINDYFAKAYNPDVGNRIRQWSLARIAQGDSQKFKFSVNWDSKNRKAVNYSTRELAAIAKERGYDGVIIKNLDDTSSNPMGLSQAELMSDIYIAFDSNQVKSVDNKNPTSDPDIRFSLSESVEETKDLVALHNLTSDKLMKSLELGGLPMPSLAITKADIPHSNFGEITLIFGKDTIDPKANKKNKAYSADAWTPVFPRVEYEADSKVAKRVSQKLRELSGKVDDYFQRDLNRVTYDFEDMLNRNGGEEGLIQRVMDNNGLKAAYLEDVGKHVEKVTMQQEAEKGFNPDSADKYQKIMDILGVTTAEEIAHVNLKDAIDNHGAELEAVYPGITKTAMRMGRLFNIVKSYIENKDGAPVYNTVTDGNATQKAVDDALDAEGYEAWVRNLFAGIEKDSGIYNNKDIFTPSGSRRSFKQTHLPFTLENIVKAMASQNDGNSKNVSGFNGIKTLRAATAETFKSVDEMHKRKNRLQNRTQEEADALNDALQSRLFKVMETIDNESGQIGDRNPYIRLDSIGEILTEIGESGKYSVADIQRVFKEYSRNVSDDTAMEVKQLLYDVTQMPVNIFESKPQRVVSFDEAKVFVIPNNADVKLKQELLNNGYNIAEYDPNVDGDRQRVVNQFEEYRFRLSYEGEQFTPSPNDVYGKDVFVQNRMDDIAPVAGESAVANESSVAPVASEAETTAEELFPDDLSPIQTELDTLLQKKEALESRMLDVLQQEDLDAFYQLNTEYEAVSERIKELEAEVAEADFDRLNSLDDMDAPHEMVREYDHHADMIPLTKKVAADIARDVRSKFGLSNKHMADVHKIIAEYSQSEFPSREQLFRSLKEKFSTYSESYSDELAQEAKSYLRTYGIKVSDSIKKEIADYADLMRRNRGRIRFSNQGTDVDVLYHEMNTLYPHLFPDDVLSPTDQFLQIVDVANMDSVTNVEQEYGDEFIMEVADSIIQSVNGYRQIQVEKNADRYGRESFRAMMESPDQYVPPVTQRNTPPTRTAQNAQPEDIAPMFDTSSGQQAFMPEVEAPKKITRGELHENIVDNIKGAFYENGYDLDEVLKNAKDLSTFTTVDNIPQRVMEKALGYKQGKVLADLTVNKVAQNETEGIKWLNSFTDRKNGLLAQISKRYNIKPGSKASAAAQMYAEGFYVGENNEIISYGDAELAKDFPDANVQKNIKGLARDPRIRQIYDETLAAINESRARNAYPEIPRLDNYFLHFRAMDDTFSRLGLPFNPNDIRAKDLPTDLNGVTADLKPGQPYFASAMHRMGKRTSFDLLGGLEKYLTSAKNQIYHIDDIQNLRALRNYIADTYGQANGLEGIDALSEEEAQEKIEKVFNSHLSTFAKFLNEEANVLAGKTPLIDRGLEGIIGRRGITLIDSINRQVGANMVGYNVSSSLTNFLAAVQGFAKSNKADFIKGFAQFSANKIKSIFGNNDGFADNSPVMIRRKGAERFHRTAWQKVSDPGYALMGMVDSISTELIARSKYNELTRKGMDSQQAHIETDKWVSRLMGDRSLGQQPQLYNSKMLGLLTKFQLEVRNQLDSQFYDTIQEAKVSSEDIENGLARNAKKAAKITSTFFQLAVSQHLFGKAFESIAGYNPAFDIIGVMLTAFGFDDDEESEDAALDNFEQAFLELLEDLPYTSTFTGGRIPISSALPISEMIKGVDQYGNEKSRLETLAEIAPYYLMPGGYGQAKKTIQGLGMFSDEHPIAGSYTDNGDLRFPVEDTLGNRIQAGLFGQWASGNASDYFDNERKPLNEKQIQEFMDVGLSIQDYWDYREGLSGLNTLAEKADYINSLNLTTEQKNVLMNNLAGREEDIDMSEYGNYESFEEFDFATKNPEKYSFFEEHGISYSDYASADEDGKRAYTWAYENPAKYKVSQVITSDFMEYYSYKSDLGDIKADKDEDGNSISGSRKEKVINYINSLDADYGEKIILFKSEYPADDTYNYEIVEYLNGRSDVSYEDMVTILAALGFKVSSDGNVTWD